MGETASECKALDDCEQTETHVNCITLNRMVLFYGMSIVQTSYVTATNQMMQQQSFHRLFFFCLCAWVCLLVQPELLYAQEPNQPIDVHLQDFDMMYEQLSSNPQSIFLEFKENHEEIKQLERLMQPNNAAQRSKLVSLSCNMPSNTKSRQQLLQEVDLASEQARSANDVEQLLRLKQCRIELTYSAQENPSVQSDIQAFMALAKRSENPYWICYSLVFAGEIFSFQQKQSIAIQYFEEAEQQCGQLPEKYGFSRIYIGQSLAYRRVKDYEHSLAYIELVEQNELFNSPFDLAHWHYEKGLIHLDKKETKESIKHLEEAHALYEENDSPIFLATIQINLARAYLADKQYERAMQAVQHSKALRQGKTNVKAFNIGFAMMVEAAILSEMGQPKKAIDMFQQANELVDFSISSQLEQIYLGYRIPNYKALGMHKEAYEAYQTISKLDDHITQQMNIQEKQIIKLKAEQLKQQAVNQQLKLQAEKNERTRSQDRIIRRWQYSTLALSSLLALLFAALIYQEVKRKRKFWQMAYSDALTQIHNRRSIFAIAKRKIEKQSKQGSHAKPFGLMIADIDHFKQINDQFGHNVGDSVLKQTVNVMNQGLRAEDHLGRIGGEEFLILIQDADQDLLQKLGQRIKQLVEDQVMLPNTQAVTISIGLTLFQTHDALEAMLSRADKALYEAKNSGRNQMRFG